MGIEIAGSLEPLDDLLGVDREQGLAGGPGLREVAAQESAPHLAHFSHRLAREEVNERVTLERLVWLAETPGGKVHQ